VKFFNTAKGFGFIEPDGGGKDVFVHATALEAAGIRALNEGGRVTFELADDREGESRPHSSRKFERRLGWLGVRHAVGQADRGEFASDKRVWKIFGGSL
jgi:CspA family cold shock protein